MKTQYLLPPVLEDTNGNQRRAGFELEFGNLTVYETAEALQKALGGTLQQENPFKVSLHDSRIGKLKIERDQHLLSSTSYRKYLQELGVDFKPGSIAHEIEKNIDNASSLIVPCEVVTEPIAFQQLAVLDDLVEALNAIGAEGTQKSLAYAYGLHINPSAPDLSASTLLAYLQSYLLLSDMIIEESRIDITRRFLTKFIDPFPLHYVEHILDNNYHPDIPHLIEDYMHHNPTRNRALDMLPVFCSIDEPRVKKHLNSLEKKLVNARPAFHYRLPDCRLGHKGWSIAVAWNYWVYIERLVDNDKLRRELINARPADKTFLQMDYKSKWIATLKKILGRHNFFD